MESCKGQINISDPSQFLHKKWVIHSNPDLTSNMVPGAIPLS